MVNPVKFMTGKTPSGTIGKLIKCQEFHRLVNRLISSGQQDD